MPISLQDTPLQNNSVDGWPSLVDMKVIVPGLVHYEDLKNSAGEHVGGNVLVQKAALDRMAASMAGKPIVNWDHRKVDPKDYAKGRAQGIITDVYYNSADGWYHARGMVWDDSTRRNIENGFSISCAYTVNEWGDGGTHNKVPYEKEVLNGNYTHIAVVPTPRYEGARIELLNSGGKPMGLLSFFRKDKPEEKVEFDPATAQVALESGSEVPLSELINSYKTVQAAKAQAPVKCGLEDMIEVDGRKVPVRELLNAHLTQLKNSMETSHKDGGHKDAPKENCGLCNSAADDEKKKKDDEEKKNAAEAEEKKKKDDDEQKNSAATAEKTAKKAAADAAAKLEEMRNKGDVVKMPEIKSLKALMAEGEARYGGKEPVVAK